MKLLWLLSAPAAVFATSLQLPRSSNVVTIKTLNTIDLSKPSIVPASGVFFPVLPGHSNMPINVYSFLIDHPKQGKFMFDLGLRQDPLNLAPRWAQAFAAGALNFSSLGVIEQLKKGNIKLESVNGVIWSHSHVDHIGDMSLWPNTTGIIIHDETDTRTWPTFADAGLLESDFAGKKITKLSFNHTSLHIGGFSAIDFFKDGSLYLLDVPGHCLGHMAALARLTPTSFVLLAGDAFNHAAQIRPSPNLAKNFPIPKDILAISQKSISREYFWSPDDSTDLSQKKATFFVPASGSDSFSFDPVTTRVSQLSLSVFDTHPDILVVGAHDASTDEYLDLFPKSLNNWKTQGNKRAAVWAFVDPKKRGYALTVNN